MDRREIPGAIFLLGFFPFLFTLFIYSMLKNGTTIGFVIFVGIFVTVWALFVISAFRAKWLPEWIGPSSDISDIPHHK